MFLGHFMWAAMQRMSDCVRLTGIFTPSACGGCVHCSESFQGKKKQTALRSSLIEERPQALNVYLY